MRIGFALSLVPAVFAVTACGEVNEFRNALPKREHVQMNVPAQQGQALLVGEESRFYRDTLNTSVAVNSGVVGILALVEAITQYPPTSVDGDVAVWGPSEPEGLERNSFRLTVERTAPGDYAYHLDARPKEATAEADFVVIFEGTAQPTADDRGTGDLDIHWGAVRQLDDSECNTGDVHVEYDASAEPRTLRVEFANVEDACRGDGRIAAATYVYTEAEDASGTLDFAVNGDIHDATENKPLTEVLAIRSRWQSDGAGRADVRVSEGEIPADLALYIPGTPATTVDLVECWGSDFSVVYADTAPDELEPHMGHPEEGDAALCVYADAEFASL